MPLSYAAILPHPPIMVPAVGGRDGLKPIEKTVQAMLAISQAISEARPEVFIIITPHGPVYPDGISVRMPEQKVLRGDLSRFGAPDAGVVFESDHELAAQIASAAMDSGIKMYPLDDGSLDHGVVAPMFYVSKALETPAKMVSLNISLEGYRKHFAFGQIIRDICAKDPRRIVFIASGDLSHRLTYDAPAGYNKEGAKFDAKLIKLLESRDAEQVLLMDPFWVDEAGECGLRSICTLLGLIDGLGFEQKKYSYEGPYGVGYLVMGYGG